MICISDLGKSVSGLLITLFLAFWSCPAALSQQAQNQIGAKVLSAETDGHNIVITVQNVSQKDIAALHLASTVTFQDGRTGGPGWIWDLAVGKKNKIWRSSHHLPPGDALGKGVLHPGESLQDSLNWDTLLNNPLIQVQPVWM